MVSKPASQLACTKTLRSCSAPRKDTWRRDTRQDQDRARLRHRTGPRHAQGLRRRSAADGGRKWRLYLGAHRRLPPAGRVQSHDDRAAAGQPAAGRVRRIATAVAHCYLPGREPRKPSRCGACHRPRQLSYCHIKIQRVGGFENALRIFDLCVAHKLGVWIGTMPELGIGQGQARPSHRSQVAPFPPTWRQARAVSATISSTRGSRSATV
jgi:hypothetical protein